MLLIRLRIKGRIEMKTTSRQDSVISSKVGTWWRGNPH